MCESLDNLKKAGHYGRCAFDVLDEEEEGLDRQNERNEFQLGQ